MKILLQITWEQERETICTCPEPQLFDIDTPDTLSARLVKVSAEKT